jgi:hypothetical protein
MTRKEAHMLRSSLRVGLTVLVCAVVIRASAAAQSPVPASGYGDELQVVNVTFDRFEPLGNTIDYASNCCYLGLAGERWVSEVNGGVLIAGIDAGLVPNGAELEQITFYVLDASAAVNENFNGRLCRSWVEVDGGNLDGDCPFSVSTSGAPGQTAIGGDPDLQVLYEADVAGGSEREIVSHFLWAFFPDNNQSGNVRLRSVRLLFRRQVSPAPAIATFADVPTNHPFFQFIEALYASGITAGCGTAIYCPDEPLTRGQMAVFLAKALGLHWPAVTAP